MRKLIGFIFLMLWLTLLASGCAPTVQIIATPNPTLKPEEQYYAYKDASYNKVSQCRNALVPFYKTINQLGEGNIEGDQAFFDNIHEYLDQIELICTILHQENPPAVWANTNDYLKQASGEYQSFVDDFRRGIKNDDPSLIEPANTHYKNANSFIDLASKELDSVQNPYE